MLRIGRIAWTGEGQGMNYEIYSFKHFYYNDNFYDFSSIFFREQNLFISKSLDVSVTLDFLINFLSKIVIMHENRSPSSYFF